MIMFGGESYDLPQHRLQSGAICNWPVNNEIFEFVFEQGREKGNFQELKCGLSQMLMIRILVGC